MKELFPILEEKNIIYLDSAATTLRPLFLLEKELRFARDQYATVHRSLYPRAQEATELYWAAKEAVRQRIGCKTTQEVVFTRGTTDSLNQIAQFLLQLLTTRREIFLSPLEHHANSLPFRALEEKGLLKIRLLPILEDGGIDFQTLESEDVENVGALSLAHISNITGVEQDLKRLGDLCRQKGWLFIVDAAQSVSHAEIDMQRQGIDFLAFSAHKMYGPTGLGVLAIAEKLLDRLTPIVFGGDMIRSLERSKMVFQDPPLCFEAGTPPICQAIALKETLEWQKTEAFQRANLEVRALAKNYRSHFEACPGVKILSSLSATTMVTLALEEAHPMDVSLLLGLKGIETRSGSLCSLPALAAYHVPAFLRLSFGVYNTVEEIDCVLYAFKEALKKSTQVKSVL